MGKLSGFVLFVFFIFISCGKDKIDRYSNGKILRKYSIDNDKEYDGKYEEYESDGNLKEIHIFKNGVKIDSSIYYVKGKLDNIVYHIGLDSSYVKFFKNEILVAEGYYKSNMKIGVWKFFRKKSDHFKTVEYINLCNKQYVNQGWDFKKNRLLNKSGNWYQIIDKKKEYKRGENIFLKLRYNSLWKSNSLSSVVFSPLISSDFCNINEVKKDSILSNKHNFLFKLNFSNSGVKNIRGYIREFQIGKDKSRERKVYINIPLLISGE